MPMASIEFVVYYAHNNIENICSLKIAYKTIQALEQMNVGELTLEK